MAQYDNGYSSTSTRLSESAYRWRLSRFVEGEERIVTEAVIVDNMVITFMPTPLQHSGCVPEPALHDGGVFAIPHVNESFRFLLDKNGKVDFITSRHDVSRIIARLKSVSTNWNPVLEVEIPCPFEALEGAISEITQISGGGLAVRHPSPPSWNEMAEQVDSARARAAKEPPDIPIIIDNRKEKPNQALESDSE